MGGNIGTNTIEILGMD